MHSSFVAKFCCRKEWSVTEVWAGNLYREIHWSFTNLSFHNSLRQDHFRNRIQLCNETWQQDSDQGFRVFALCGPVCLCCTEANEWLTCSCFVFQGCLNSHPCKLGAQSITCITNKIKPQLPTTTRCRQVQWRPGSQLQQAAFAGPGVLAWLQVGRLIYFICYKGSSRDVSDW